VPWLSIHQRRALHTLEFIGALVGILAQWAMQGTVIYQRV
jgi:hypothetical protein